MPGRTSFHRKWFTAGPVSHFWNRRVSSIMFPEEIQSSVDDSALSLCDYVARPSLLLVNLF
jgi:hypothetical protein